MRRLRRLEASQRRELELQAQMLALLERLEHPLVVLPLASPTPTSEPTHPPSEPQEQLLVEPPIPVPPALTPQELAELAAIPMPDPVEEIAAALGQWTSPPSQRTSED